MQEFSKAADRGEGRFKASRAIFKKQFQLSMEGMGQVVSRKRNKESRLGAQSEAITIRSLQSTAVVSVDDRAKTGSNAGKRLWNRGRFAVLHSRVQGEECYEIDGVCNRSNREVRGGMHESPPSLASGCSVRASAS